LDIPDARHRFEREARSAAGLAHPHIVAVHDFGEHESQPYIVMEYVRGETLAEVVRRKAPVAFADKLRWIEELASAVGYAHKMSVIHRDIKPANLMIDRFGRLKVLDFGIARMLGTASHTKDTIGTPGYMAPEQILGNPVDGRADLFSIGVVFYELLSYTEAFPGDTGPAITHRILTQDPIPLPRLVPDLNPDVLPIIERLLKKNADDRFADAEAFGVAVGRVRRTFEDSAAAAAAPTVLLRDTPGPKRGRSGTRSGKRPTTDAVGVVTPPPVDRETLARRRSAQLEAALSQARTLLARGDLEMALDACQQALTLDERHPDALKLEGMIRVAFAERQVAALKADEAAAPVDDDEEVDEIAGPAVVGSEYAPTVLAPPRRTPAPQPAPLPPPTRPSTAERPRRAAPPRKAPTPSLLTRLRTAAGTVPSRLGAVTGAITARVRTVAPAVTASARALVPTRLPVIRPVGRKAMIAWSAAAGVLLVAIIVTAVRQMPAAIPPPTGVVVIEAVPWGTITAVEAENGEPRPLPAPASTPLSLVLPAGTYQVTVAGPVPDTEAQRVTVRVEPNAAIVAPMIKFPVLTPEEYFEQYLTAPPAPADVVPPPADTSAPALAPALAPPPAGVSQ
ncbi:MAG TPA: protein kinase, partial [Vicinamibacterales bacterium]